MKFVNVDFIFMMNQNQITTCGTYYEAYSAEISNQVQNLTIIIIPKFQQLYMYLKKQMFGGHIQVSVLLSMSLLHLLSIKMLNIQMHMHLLAHQS